MKRFSQLAVWALVLALVLGMFGCVHDTTSTADNSTAVSATIPADTAVVTAPNKLVQNSVKLLYTADEAAEMVFSILGDMYKEGYFDAAQKDKFVAMGHAVISARDLANSALISYQWAVENADAAESERTKQILINSLVKFAKEFYAMKDNVAASYNGLTGQTIKIPDIFMFDTISSLLYQ